MVLHGKIFFSEKRVFLEHITRSLKLQQFILIPFITYKYAHAFAFVCTYTAVHLVADFCKYAINFSKASSIRKLAISNLGLFVFLGAVFTGMALVYRKVQQGPILYKKYLYISILSNIYFPVLAFLISSRLMHLYLLLFVTLVYFAVACVLGYRNMPFISLLEGNLKTLAWCVILVNNAVLIALTLLYFYVVNKYA